jgi:hypothetical protein
MNVSRHTTINSNSLPNMTRLIADFGPVMYGTLDKPSFTGSFVRGTPTQTSLPGNVTGRIDCPGADGRADRLDPDKQPQVLSDEEARCGSTFQSVTGLPLEHLSFGQVNTRPSLGHSGASSGEWTRLRFNFGKVWRS